MKNPAKELAEEILIEAVSLGSYILLVPHSGGVNVLVFGGSQRTSLVATEAIDYALSRDWLFRQPDGAIFGRTFWASQRLHLRRAIF